MKKRPSDQKNTNRHSQGMIRQRKTSTSVMLRRLLSGTTDIVLTFCVLLAWKEDSWMMVAQSAVGDALTSLPISLGVPLGLGVGLLMALAFPRVLFASFNYASPATTGSSSGGGNSLLAVVPYFLVAQVYPYLLCILAYPLMSVAQPTVSNLLAISRQLSPCLQLPGDGSLTTEVFHYTAASNGFVPPGGGSPPSVAAAVGQQQQQCDPIAFVFISFGWLLYFTTIIQVGLCLGFLLVNPIGMMEAVGLGVTGSGGGGGGIEKRGLLRDSLGGAGSSSSGRIQSKVIGGGDPFAHLLGPDGSVLDPSSLFSSVSSSAGATGSNTSSKHRHHLSLPYLREILHVIACPVPSWSETETRVLLLWEEEAKFEKNRKKKKKKKNGAPPRRSYASIYAEAAAYHRYPTYQRAIKAGKKIAPPYVCSMEKLHETIRHEEEEEDEEEEDVRRSSVVGSSSTSGESDDNNTNDEDDLHYQPRVLSLSDRTVVVKDLGLSSSRWLGPDWKRERTLQNQLEAALLGGNGDDDDDDDSSSSGTHSSKNSKGPVKFFFDRLFEFSWDCFCFLIALPLVLMVSSAVLFLRWISWCLGLPSDFSNRFLVDQLLQTRDNDPLLFTRHPLVLSEYQFQRTRCISSLAHLGMFLTVPNLAGHFFVAFNSLSIAGIFLGDHAAANSSGDDGPAPRRRNALDMYGVYGTDRRSFRLPVVDTSVSGDYVHYYERWIVIVALIFVDLVVTFVV